MKKALNKNPTKRPTIQEMLESDWIVNKTQQGRLDSGRELDLSHNLAAFTKTTAFQSGVCSIMANLMTEAEDLKELRTMFTKWDLDSNGYISQEELEQNIEEVCSVFNLDAPDVRQLMKRADSNGDGQVDYTEFLTAAFDKKKLLS